jgi:hypothetical protein
VAWVLACVFLRFMEDNDLIDECWLAGEGDRRKLAEGAYELYFRQHPHETDREYLKHVFTEIRKIPAATELFAEGKTPLWAVDPSGDAARHLLEYFREIDAEQGGLKRSFATIRTSTQPLFDVYEKLAPQARFLGDLYQDLSEHAQKKYALKQTPEFIEQFILDRTLTYAIDEFGLKDLRLIDPTCGSGHFLLGAFDRLFSEWMKPERGIDNPVVAAQNALDSIFGVDINSFAVAITRFRLLVAAVNACGINKLHQQSYAWKLNLATGDSLLWGSRPAFNNERSPISHQGDLFEIDPILAVEDPVSLREILGQGYHVVVGNPPYIRPPDKAQVEAYRRIYSTCHGQYSLGVPFTQRFWELAIRFGERIRGHAEPVSRGAGYIGMITANSFMKKEFGKKLIGQFFPSLDLTHVIDTSGAFIPGHGTPTVILFGRSRRPVANTVRAVLGINSEPTVPDEPAKGMVWQSIVKHVDAVNCQDAFTSSADVPRITFNSHPWSIGGGGASDLKLKLENACPSVLRAFIDPPIGRAVRIASEEVFTFTENRRRHSRCPEPEFRGILTGEDVRDWFGRAVDWVWYPYSATSSRSDMIRQFWPWRTLLANRATFEGVMADAGRDWWEYMQHTASAYATPLSITFSNLETHNHFHLDRGGNVFNAHAPVIKLVASASEEDHLRLLGVLNSSTACFWMHQVSHNNGRPGANAAAADERWEFRFEYDGTKLQNLPIPEEQALDLARQLDRLAREYASNLPEAIVRAATPTAERLRAARMLAETIRGRMIALQEELDWQCYQLYGLLENDLRYTNDDLPELTLGQRAFEIVMARQVVQGDLITAWFDRFHSTPTTEVPTHWPPSYRALLDRRIKLIETNLEIGLIETPEFKRRWQEESWDQLEQEAIRRWLLDWLERHSHGSTPELTTVALLADMASGNAEFMQVGAIYRGRSDFDVTALVHELVESKSIPFLPVLRYKTDGLWKQELWKRTWDLQRKKDLGEYVGDITVPPKYTSADFQKTDYWRLRGKYDVPKERWVSYPHCHTDSDPSLVVGWAGWNHLQQAEALIAYYDARKREGWDAKRLTPILAGLDQLLPWIHQWHPEIDPEFGETAGRSYQTLLEQDAHELGLTLDDIRNWQPPATTNRRRARK